MGTCEYCGAESRTSELSARWSEFGVEGASVCMDSNGCDWHVNDAHVIGAHILARRAAAKPVEQPLETLEFVAPRAMVLVRDRERAWEWRICKGDVLTFEPETKPAEHTHDYDLAGSWHLSRRDGGGAYVLAAEVPRVHAELCALRDAKDEGVELPTECIDVGCSRRNEGGFSGRCKQCTYEEMKRCKHPRWDHMLDACHDCGLGGKLRAIWEAEKKKSDPYAGCQNSDNVPLMLIGHAHHALLTARNAASNAITGKEEQAEPWSKPMTMREAADQMRPVLAELEKLLERLRP